MRFTEKYIQQKQRPSSITVSLNNKLNSKNFKQFSTFVTRIKILIAISRKA